MDLLALRLTDAARCGLDQQDEAVESGHARVSGRTFDGEDGSDGTRTRDLRRDRPAF